MYCVLVYPVYHFIFFFQAEDGIRDLYVTGVQTCALPICEIKKVAVKKFPAKRDRELRRESCPIQTAPSAATPLPELTPGDRKSTRLNSSHVEISYAVFCLKKKKKQTKTNTNDNNHKQRRY